MALSDRDRTILDLEGGWWREGGTKEQAIRRILGLSTSRYYALLGPLCDTDDAWAYDPLVALRVRRLRAARRRARIEGRSAGGPATR
jgi:Protein of unknown function (DUF3263)